MIQIDLIYCQIWLINYWKSKNKESNDSKENKNDNNNDNNENLIDNNNENNNINEGNNGAD